MWRNVLFLVGVSCFLLAEERNDSLAEEKESYDLIGFTNDNFADEMNRKAFFCLNWQQLVKENREYLYKILAGKEAFRVDLGRDELPLGGRIAFVNGIDTTVEEEMIFLALISDICGGFNVYGVYHQTLGPVNDILAAAAEVSDPYFESQAVSEVIKVWKDFFQKDKENCFLQMCTSQGSAIVRNALTLITPEERKRIIVVVISPAAIIDDTLCRRVDHYISTNDYVYMLDMQHVLTAKKSTLHFLIPHKDAPSFDHNFASPTFRDRIKGHILQYVNNPKGL